MYTQHVPIIPERLNRRHLVQSRARLAASYRYNPRAGRVIRSIPRKHARFRGRILRKRYPAHAHEVTFTASRAQLRAPLVGSELPRSAASPNSRLDLFPPDFLGDAARLWVTRGEDSARWDPDLAPVDDALASPPENGGFRNDAIGRIEASESARTHSDEVSRSTVRLAARLPYFTLGFASRSTGEPTRPSYRLTRHRGFLRKGWHEGSAFDDLGQQDAATSWRRSAQCFSKRSFGDSFTHLVTQPTSRRSIAPGHFADITNIYSFHDSPKWSLNNR